MRYKNSYMVNCRDRNKEKKRGVNSGQKIFIFDFDFMDQRMNYFIPVFNGHLIKT